MLDVEAEGVAGGEDGEPSWSAEPSMRFSLISKMVLGLRDE